MSNNNIPLVVLPCSADKLSYPAKAIDFYLGKGYLPVLKNKTNLHTGRDYHLAFMSAKYGLVLADETLLPYDLEMTAKQSHWLIDNKSACVKHKLRNLNPSKIIACLPKLYLSTLEQMIIGHGQTINIVKPAKGSGIGSQRQFLSLELDKLSQGMTTFFVFHNLNSKQQTITTLIEVRAGDVFTPYLRGVGENRKIGAAVKVKSVIVKNDLPIIIDEHNRKHSVFDISNGLSNEQRSAAIAYGGFYEPHINLAPITVSLSQINRDVFAASQKVA